MTKRDINRAIKRGFKASNVLLADTARGLAPSDNGHLAGSIDANQISETKSQVGTPLDYGLYQERGTGLYALDGGRQTPWVYPVIGYTDSKGRPLFRWTQGTEPKRYIETSFEQNVNNVRMLFEKYLQQVGK